MVKLIHARGSTSRRLDSLDDSTIDLVLRRLGIVRSAFAAIQIDVNPVSKKTDSGYRDVTLCDHNCTVAVNGHLTGGQYICPAAMSINRGLSRGDLAPTVLLLRGLQSTIAALRQARHTFLGSSFNEYCRDFSIPSNVGTVIRKIVDTDVIEVNLFGGSPEIHPGILSIIAVLRSGGNRVHLTTTGRRLIQEPAFLEAFLQNTPDLLALGADDFDGPEEIGRLSSLSLADLHSEWRHVDPYHGQRKKSYEAIYLIKLSQMSAAFPPILLNIVVHPGNVAYIEDLLDSLQALAPAVILNPYPVQTAFIYERSQFAPNQLRKLERFVDLMLDQHIVSSMGGKTRWTVALRAHYWLLLKASLRAMPDAGAAAAAIGGDGIWKCYSHSGATRCVQIASSSSPHDKGTIPGGHLGCFWNHETITDDRHVWEMKSGEIEDWLFRDRLALSAASRRPCPGCAFPRMSFDSISLDLGMGSSLRPEYLALRSEALGY